MERRKALKNIGLSLGSLTMSSAVVTLIQSCTQEKKVSWNPVFFSPDEADIVSKTLEVMIPKTPDVPGATDLNLAQFIDGYLDVISTEKEKTAFKAGVEQYLSTTLEKSGKNVSTDLTEGDIEKRVAHYFKADAENKKKWNMEVVASKKEGAQLPSDDAVNFFVLNSLRNRGIEAFKVSKIIGEEVLAYDPIPGAQKGCVDLQEVSGGRAWSL